MARRPTSPGSSGANQRSRYVLTLSFDDATAPNDEAPDGEKLRAAVAAALGRINPRYRRALELRFFEEHERTACAAALEIKVGTFDVLLLRALRAFRAAWVDSP